LLTWLQSALVVLVDLQGDQQMEPPGSQKKTDPSRTRSMTSITL
jgi:hypothetical protein